MSEHADTSNPSADKPTTPASPATAQHPWKLPGHEPYLLLVLLTLALLLRLPGLTESVWFDELWSTRIKLQSAGRLWDILRFDVHPPAYTVFMFAWIRLFGDSELAIRMPSLLSGLGSIVLVYMIGRRFVPRTGAWIAAGLLCVSPVHIWYSQEARHYALLVFLVLLAIEAFYRVRTGPAERYWWWIHGLALIGAVFTHYYAIAFVGVLGLIVLVDPGPHRYRMLAIHSGVILALVLFLGVRAGAGELTTSMGHLGDFRPGELFYLLFDWFLTGNAVFTEPQWSDLPLVLWQWAVWIPLGVLFILGVSTVSRVNAGFHLLLYLAAIPAVLFTMTVVGFDGFFIERSGLAALPFFLLVLGAGIAGIRWMPLRTTVLMAVVVGASVVLTGFYTKQDVWTVYKPNPDWRSAARALELELALSEPVIVFTTTSAEPLLYYDLVFSTRSAGHHDVVEKPPERAEPSSGVLGRISAWTAYGGPGEHPPAYQRGAVDELIHLRSSPPVPTVAGVLNRTGVNRFFLVHNRYWPGSFEQVFQTLKARYQVIDRRRFEGLELIEMSPRPL